MTTFVQPLSCIALVDFPAEDVLVTKLVLLICFIEQSQIQMSFTTNISLVYLVNLLYENGAGK